ILLSLLLAFAGLIFGSEVRGETAAQVLAKAAGKAKSAKGIEASYSMRSAGRSITGSLKSAGSKFYVKAGSMESWYNGKELYSYNPSTKETTVVNPTPSEIAEINPLLYLSSYNQYFEPVYSKNKQSGKFIIDLKIKSKKTPVKPVKKITVFLNSKTYQPEKFLITSLDGNVVTLTISKISYAANFGSSVFEYPNSRFPKATIVDLR
ncbi:MAG: hypothetical protein K2H76_07550, partial [Muribaculaceae bacterium]|nr:hypothetical protein [Muribaculaceae bacterium]